MNDHKEKPNESAAGANVILASEQALASSAHARINIPLNLDNWRSLDEDTRSDLLWFHQQSLDDRLSLKEAGEALGYDTTTIFRVLKGTYEGSWSNITRSIQSYRKLVVERGQIQQTEFVVNSPARMIFTGLTYALANGSITTIIGESRFGKTAGVDYWRTENNHGRCAYVVAPPIGGTKALLRRIAAVVGANKNLSSVQISEAVIRAFNRNRLLIVDEAHRLLPFERRVNPTSLEVIRDIHDMSKCGLALIATQRLELELKRTEYMFEQIIGRIGMPVRLRSLKDADWIPIVRQYIPRPTKALLDQCRVISNAPGRLGILVETLKCASRFAAKDKSRTGEEHFFRAVALRRQMSGE